MVNDIKTRFSITGTATVGNTLSITEDTPDPDGTGTLSYSWQSSSDNSNWSQVSTSSTYTLTTAEEGKYIQAVISYKDDEYFPEIVTTSSLSVDVDDLLDKDNASKSFYHLRNWENLPTTDSLYVDYSIDIPWVYQNLPTNKVRWAVWDGGYDGDNIIDRGPYENLSVYHYDATDLELNFIKDTFNDLDEHLELDFEQVNWEDNAEIYIWLVDGIEEDIIGYSLIDNEDIYGNVEILVDVTDGIGGNYTKNTIVHELGHAIGLSHPGINGEDSPYWDLYTSKDTIMSYNPDANGDYGTTFTDLDIQALKSIWGSEGSYGGNDFDINKNSPIVSKQNVSSHSIGAEYELLGITDYDGNLHANTGIVSDELKSAYKYQGKLDVNKDGIVEAIYTNKVSGRWVTAKLDTITGLVDYSDHGENGGTRVVGIYDDPLIAVGLANGGYLDDGVTPAPANFDVSDADRYLDLNGDGDFDDDNEDRLALNSQVRFQNDLFNDNLSLKHSGDYDGDGFQEVYWKTIDSDVYLRALMHADGNIQYANYQNEEQLIDYLTGNGNEGVIGDII